MAVRFCKIWTDATSIHKPVNRPQQVALRYMIVDENLTKKARLAPLALILASSIPLRSQAIESVSSPPNQEEFFNEIRPS